MKSNANKTNYVIRDFFFSYGLFIVLGLVIIYFSVAAPNFFRFTTLISTLHNAAPIMVVASGLAFVIMTSYIDISVGSIMFLSSAVGVYLISRLGYPFWIGILAALIVGIISGAINGFITVVLHVNPWVTTLGTQMAFRGVALQLTGSSVISLPSQWHMLGNKRIGPIYVDIIIALIVLLITFLIHTRTPFGRHVMAIGSNAEVAKRLGVKVNLDRFLTFVFSGFMASVGGLLMMFQLGAVSPSSGSGAEFTAIALLVIGGVSLYGGEGTILPGVLVGGFAMTIIEAGLNYIGASVYVYPFVRGGIIFIAMFADALKLRIKPKVKMMEEESISNLREANS